MDNKADGKEKGEGRKDEEKKFSFFNKNTKVVSDGIKVLSKETSGSIKAPGHVTRGVDEDVVKADDDLTSVADGKEARVKQGAYEENLRKAAIMVGSQKKRQSSSSNISGSSSSRFVFCYNCCFDHWVLFNYLFLLVS